MKETARQQKGPFFLFKEDSQDKQHLLVFYSCNLDLKPGKKSARVKQILLALGLGTISTILWLDSKENEKQQLYQNTQTYYMNKWQRPKRKRKN